jgi:hypothetical protein
VELGKQLIEPLLVANPPRRGVKIMKRRELLLGLAGAAGAGAGLGMAQPSASIEPGREAQRHYSGYVNVPIEISFTGVESYKDVFNDIELDVAFRGPGGQEWRAPAFWAGDRTFCVRFSPPVVGEYTYESACTNPVDAGLHGRTGALNARPYEGSVQLYKRGRLRVAASRRTMEHQDGTPFFWLGDTWWFGLIKRLDWPFGFRRLTADRVAKGFSAIQIVAGPLPDYDGIVNPFDPQQSNEAGLSWEDGWRRINPTFYDLADLRIAHLVESGLVPCIVGMWGYFLPCMGVEKVKKHWRNLVARYGAWPVVWCVAGEVNMPTYSLVGENTARRDAMRTTQEEGWTEVTRYVRHLDPFHNPITAHPSHPDSRAMLRDESVLDMDMLQTGHSGYPSLMPSLKALADCITKRPRMPTFIGEADYEGIMGGSKDEVQRFLFWTSMTSGACGHTYGAQGLWAMNSPQEEHRGFTGSWGDGYWTDVMNYPGSRQMGVGRKFFERYPWWLLEPRSAPALQGCSATSSYATGVRKAVAIFYLPLNCLEEGFYGLEVKGCEQIAIEPGASYEAYFFNPRTGQDVRSYVAASLQKITLGPVAPDANGYWKLPPKPTMEDWVLVLENRQELQKLAPR